MSSATPAALRQSINARSFWFLLSITVFAVAGLGLFWWQFLILWSIWINDSLRSIGAAVIPCSIFLLFYSLRREDFESHGSWWGLVLVTLGLVGANLQYYGIIGLRFSHTQLSLIPIALM